MSGASIPPDVMDAAREMRSAVIWESNASVEVIAQYIVADRKRCAAAILNKRYTEDQGIDAEMEAFNGGLEDAAKLLRGEL